MIVLGHGGTATFPITHFAIVNDDFSEKVNLVCVGANVCEDINAKPFASYKNATRARKVLKQIVEAYTAGNEVYCLPSE